MTRNHRVHHVLKLSSLFWRDVFSEKKTFEIRRNDRDFQLDDTVSFQYVGAVTGELEGEPQGNFVIKYITDFEQKEGFVVFAMRRLN